MLGIETQYKLRDFFKAVAEEELIVERQRQHLAAVSDFEPYAAFKRVNRSGDEKVTALEIYYFLRDNGVNYCTLVDCGFLLKYFDTDMDGALNYTEFMQVLLPCDDLYLRSAATQRPTYHIGRYDRLPTIVEKELVTLFEREIHYHTKTEMIKQELQRRYDWNPRSAFECIDSLRIGSVDHRSVNSFLRVNGYYATESELVTIIRRLDIDADQKITYDEFVEAVRPQISVIQSSYPRSPSKHDEEFKREASPLRASGANLAPPTSS